MRHVTLNELGQLVSNSREGVWAEARRYGREPKIYLHWSAGRYETPFEDYHINITGDGDIIIPDEDMSITRKHTWCRNSGSIGISLCACYGATTYDLDAGGYAPTAKQIETMAQVIAVVADALWLTINKQYVLTHGEAANNEDGLWLHPAYAAWNDEEGKGDVRWDLEFLGNSESPRYNPYLTDGSRGGDVLRGKAAWYKAQKG